VRLAALLAISLCASGCYFSRSPTRPVPALFQRTGTTRASCLVIFLPGLLDSPDSFLDHGMVRDLRESGAPCDAVMVDLHYRYYFDGHASDVIYEDVLLPAVARGYKEIWVVGISLGGMGATLLAREHGASLAGIVLLSPFLGIEPIRSEVVRTGLPDWHPGPLPRAIDDATFTRFVWAYLRGYVDDPDEMPPMYVGWAEGETQDAPSRTLAAVLPSDRVATVEGRHDWDAWTRLFRTLIARARPGR
jgi:pimeloyl-ACP methyl ester carboxylesterase